ncbi:MAG: transcriptional repressor [Thermodesulfobacteriota bacterium]
MSPTPLVPPALAERARELLAERGVRPTRARVLVLSHLLAQPEALAPRSLHAMVGGEAAVNRVTLYRILDLLVEQGLAARSSAGDRSLRYCSGRSTRVCHFRCLRCGQVRCMDPALLPLSPDAVKKDLGVRVERIEIRVDGLCEACGGR